MSASILDLITGVATGDQRPVVTTLTAQKIVGASSISCDSLNGWEIGTAVHFAIYRKDAQGNKIAGSQTDWKGIVSGTSIISLDLRAGTDDIYPIGSVVECMPTAAWAEDLVSGLLTTLNTDGTIKDGVIATNDLADSSVTSAKVNFGGSGAGIWWEEIGRTVLGSAATTITVGSLPARKYLMVIASTKSAGGNVNNYIRFNGDSANNYSDRSVEDGVSASSSALSYILLAGYTTPQDCFAKAEIVNIANQEKLVEYTGTRAGITGANSTVGHRTGSGKWSNTSALINSVSIVCDSGAPFGVGSEVIVLGHN